MKQHPFEIVSSSSNPTVQRFAELLSPDVVFHSPGLRPSSHQARLCRESLKYVHQIFGRPIYRLRLSEGRTRSFGLTVKSTARLSKLRW